MPGALGMMARGGLTQEADAVRGAGRAGDTVAVHLSPEELEALRLSWGEPTINPETGLPEYFKLGDLFKFLLPAASAFVPGLGSGVGEAIGLTGQTAALAGNALLGAGLGAVTGGGTKGALRGGALGALSSLAAPYIKEAFSGAGDFLGGAGGEDGGALGLTPKAVESSELLPPGFDEAAQASFGRETAASDLTSIAGSDGALDFLADSGAEKEPSFLSKYKMPLLLGGGALALSGLGAEQPGATAGAPERRPEVRGPEAYFERSYKGPETAAPYYTYGEVPFSFFEDNVLRDRRPEDEEDEQPSVGVAQGGALRAVGHLQGGLGDGRADTIPARLSNDEYVMDAETVALLGNGSAAAGAKQLDALRERLRKHKGKALAKGKFSPDARRPESYLKGSK